VAVVTEAEAAGQATKPKPVERKFTVR